MGIHQSVPKQDAPGTEDHPYLTTREYLQTYAPSLLEFMTWDDPAAAFAADEEWMADRELELGIPRRVSPTGERLYHVALLGWCFSPARD